MNPNSTDEDELTYPVVSDTSPEDYMETCDNELNDIVPRLQRLYIDDESKDLRSENMNIPNISVDHFPSLTSSNQGAMISYSNSEVYRPFIDDASAEIEITEVTKAATVSEKSPSETKELSQCIPANMQIDTQNISPVVIQKALANAAIPTNPINQKDGQNVDQPIEMQENEREDVSFKQPLNLCPKNKLDHNYIDGSSFSVSINKTEPQPSTSAPAEIKRLDPETGEVLHNSSIILRERHDSDEISDTLIQHDDGIRRKLSYSSDISSDNQSCKSTGVNIDSSPDCGAVNLTSTKLRRSREAKDFLPSSIKKQSRHRRFGIFQPQNSKINETNENYSSEEESKKSVATEKAAPINPRRRYRKPVKSPPTVRIPSNAQNREEKRPSPRKRKNTTSKTLAESTGKFRKRSKSAHNSDSGENSHSVIRSRSLSPDSRKKICGSVINPCTEIPLTRKSRKRTNSDLPVHSGGKVRRSSDSSDEAKN